MIQHKKGDLIVETWNPSISTIIAHVVNDKGLMGAGFAKQLKDYYPDVYARYRDFCRSKLIAHGNNLYCMSFRSANITVANMFAQFGLYNRITNPVPLCEVSLRSCIKALFSRAVQDGVKEIHMPKVGSGLVKGNWSRIFKIIEEEHAECLVRFSIDLNVSIWELENQMNGIYREE